MKHPCEGSCVKDLVFSAMLKGGAFGKVIGYGDFDLINRFNHWYIHLLALLGGGRN